MFVKKLSLKCKSIKFQYTRLIKSISKKDYKLYKFIDKYFSEYCKHNNISENKVISIRKKFLDNYLENLNRFSLNKKYDDLNRNIKLSRTEYDIILLLSYLIEFHRFKIVKLLIKENYKGDILVIGSGPSIEIALIKLFLKKKTNIMAYDISYNSFIKKKFKKEYKESEYIFNSKKFNYILIIEFLEHLHEPYSFLKNLKKSMKKDGKIILTTAINIPQFDHLFNFKKNEILKKTKLMHYKKKKYYYIEHKMFISKFKSSNEYVVLIK